LQIHKIIFKQLLSENFDSDKTGIEDGFLYIFSIDSAKEQSSNGPQNVSFYGICPGGTK
jgi:hypothetical protein